MTSRYYEAELAYLRDQGREFARTFPSTAGYLAERSDDPDVERLLEGFAFLASRIRERVDDGMPEFAQRLGSILVPQLTRFIPSCAIIQFEPDARALRRATQIPRGAEVAGTASDGTRCRFRTTHDTHLLPIELLDLRFERSSSRRSQITLKFRAPPQGLDPLGQTPIRLYMHGDTPFACTLRTWLLHHCSEIEVLEDGERRGLLRGKPRCLGFDLDSRLLPEKPLEHDAFASIAELFAFPPKFCFVDLPPIGALVCPNFELRLTFDTPPDLPRRVSLGDIRINCTPVINLFDATSDPLRFEPLKPEVMVRCAERSPTDLEVYDITQVVGSREGHRKVYPSFTEYGASEAETPHDELYYSTRRVSSRTSSGTDLYVSLHTPRDAAPVACSETLSLDLLVSNRGAAATLALGEINQAVRSSPVFVKFSNITSPTPPLYPHDDVELLWRLSSHVGLSRQGLRNADSLARMLRSYNFSARFDAHAGRRNSRWIDATREVSSRKIVRLHRGAPITGTKTTLLLDEADFGAAGEAMLFGEAISELFARLAHINSFNQLALRMIPSEREHTWPPQNGSSKLG